jgi:hypothetical protein
MYCILRFIHTPLRLFSPCNDEIDTNGPRTWARTSPWFLQLLRLFGTSSCFFNFEALEESVGHHAVMMRWRRTQGANGSQEKSRFILAPYLFVSLALRTQVIEVRTLLGECPCPIMPFTYYAKSIQSPVEHQNHSELDTGSIGAEI